MQRLAFAATRFEQGGLKGAAMVTVYGIKNCDTIKKARAWLDQRGIDYTFHDYKAAGADECLVREWVDAFGWETLLNRAGTTFRKLPDGDKADLDAEKAVKLMEQGPWNEGLLNELSTAMRDASICGLGQAAPNPLQSVMKHFPEDLKKPLKGW